MNRIESRSPATLPPVTFTPEEAAAVAMALAAQPDGPYAAAGRGALAKIASGGELSRIMLALMCIAAAGPGGAQTLVFDEVDAGIGGQTARAVGDGLRELAAERQVICITHLPQVASLAARHFSIAKDTTRTPAQTTVSELREDEVVSELVRMLGADDSADDAARRHAEELLRAA